MSNLLYHETQRMTGVGPLIILILGFVAFVFFQFRVKKLLTRIISVITFIVVAIVLAIMGTLKLDTLYYTDRVEFQFISLVSAKYEAVAMDSVTKVKLITYNPEDYGGWGLKSGLNTKVYNASGNRGLMFTFKSGQQLLLGTNQPDSLSAHLKNSYPFQP